jgi:hypothetical protein
MRFAFFPSDLSILLYFRGPKDDLLISYYSEGTILLIYDRAMSHVPLKILSIEDGKPLKSVKLWLHPNKEISFIEQFNEKIFVKQEDENLQIIDVWHNLCVICYIYFYPRVSLKSPSSLII